MSRALRSILASEGLVKKTAVSYQEKPGRGNHPEENLINRFVPVGQAFGGRWLSKPRSYMGRVEYLCEIPVGETGVTFDLIVRMYNKSASSTPGFDWEQGYWLVAVGWAIEGFRRDGEHVSRELSDRLHEAFPQSYANPNSGVVGLAQGENSPAREEWKINERSIKKAQNDLKSYIRDALKKFELALDTRDWDAIAADMRDLNKAWERSDASAMAKALARLDGNLQP